ncbi:deoxyhypusine hydroxylase, partial [Modicella reniformis]
SVLALADGFDDPSALFRHEITYVFGQMQHPAAVSSLIKVPSNLNEANMVRHEAAEGPWIDCHARMLPCPGPVPHESCVVALDMYEYENNEQLQYADGLSRRDTRMQCDI